MVDILRNPISQAIPASASSGILIRQIEKESFSSAIIVPLIYRGHTNGILEVYSRTNKLEIFDRELIRVLATQGAIVIQDMQKTTKEASHSH